MKYLFFTIVGLFFVGCASVSYLPTDDSITYPPTKSVKIFWETPNIPYTKIGIVSAQASSDSGYKEEELFKLLKEKAMSIGADGIIMDAISQQQKTSSGLMVTPNFSGGTNLTPVMSSGTAYRLVGIAIKFK